MPVVGLPPADRRALVEAIDRWSRRQLELDTALVAVDRDGEIDRWYLRMRGEEKEFITVWMTLGELTLRYETQFMPAPEANLAACYEYLLRRNRDLYGMRFAIADEDAVYLVGQLPVGAVDEAELDRILGSAYAYVEECFATAMSLGYPGRFRRP